MLWISNGFTLVGFQLRNMVQGWLALQLTNSSLWVGITNGAPALLAIPLSLISGIITDRSDPRRILSTVRFLLALLAFLTGFLITTNLITVWYVILLAMLAGGINAFGLPASQTLVFDIVGRDRLLRALALNNGANAAGNFLGPSLAGVMIASLGIDSVFYVLSAGYLIAFVTAILIPPDAAPRTVVNTPLMRGIGDGLRYTKNNRHVGWILFLAFLAIFGSAFLSLVPAYARDILQAGPVGFGMIMGAQGIGNLISTTLVVWKGDIQNKGAAVALAAMVWGMGMLIFAFSRSLVLSIFCAGFMGMSGPVWMSCLHTLLQTTVPPDMRGRILSLFTLTFQTVPLGFLLGGILAENFGEQTALVSCSLLWMSSNILVYIFARELRTIE